MKRKPKTDGPRKYPCAICGHRAIAEELIYSTHTGQRYCPLTDAAACTRRKRARARKESSTMNDAPAKDVWTELMRAESEG